MAEVTVSELAKVVGASAERLLMQMKEAEWKRQGNVFFFNGTATTEIYTILFVGSVRCV